MKPAPFEYEDPRSIDETLERLAALGEDAKILAGGQSLAPMLNFRLARPAIILDINRVDELDSLHEEGGVLRAGALVRQRTLERWATTRAPLLAAGLRSVGHAAIRHRGTVAGSIAHADPAAELPALLLCCDGYALAASRRGERLIPAHELFVGPLMTTLRPDELVVETRWLLPGSSAGWGFHEVARRHGDFALAGAAAVVGLREGTVQHARLAVFGCAPTPALVPVAQAMLMGQTPTPERIDEAARAGAESLDPTTDLHAPAEYRRRAARTLMARALADAVRGAGGKGR